MLHDRAFLFRRKKVPNVSPNYSNKIAKSVQIQRQLSEKQCMQSKNVDQMFPQILKRSYEHFDNQLDLFLFCMFHMHHPIV